MVGQYGGYPQQIENVICTIDGRPITNYPDVTQYLQQQIPQIGIILLVALLVGYIIGISTGYPLDNNK